ncbi:hypothetical protein ABPG72_014065 [Tetrahymena utriculariae]
MMYKVHKTIPKQYFQLLHLSFQQPSYSIIQGELFFCLLDQNLYDKESTRNKNILIKYRKRNLKYQKNIFIDNVEDLSRQQTLAQNQGILQRNMLFTLQVSQETTKNKSKKYSSIISRFRQFLLVLHVQVGL